MNLSGKDILDILTVIFAFVATVLSILAFVKSNSNDVKEQKKLTIDNYHRISDKDGALWWLYHMTDKEYNDILYLAKLDHDSLRSARNDNFIQLEDMLGMLDEFGSAIECELYDYETFNKLAGNYCKERVTPHLAAILNTYGRDSYVNIKSLVKRLNNEVQFTEEEKVKRSYEVLVALPDYILDCFRGAKVGPISEHYNKQEFCNFLDEMLESYLYGDLIEKRVYLTDEQIQFIENKRKEVKKTISMCYREYFKIKG